MGASSNPHATSILPLLLQKPSLKSKNREHVKYMNERMAIQTRLKKQSKTKNNQTGKLSVD